MSRSRVRRPTELPVGGISFDILWDKRQLEKRQCGETRYPEREIIVNPELDDLGDERRTLLHEGVHAALLVSGLDEVFESLREKLGFDLEEAVATAVENNLDSYIRALVKCGYFR